MATDGSSSQNLTTLKRKSSSSADFNSDSTSNHDKLKSIWMDIIAEKAGDNSDEALAMIQQLPNILYAFDKAVEKGYVLFCCDGSESSIIESSKSLPESTSSSTPQPPAAKVQKIIYDKVIYAPTWIFKKWKVPSLDTDFTIKTLEIRPYPKTWFKQELENWKKETQVALVVHNEWQSSKISEIATKINDSVGSFKVIIESNRKDATEFCQNLIAIGIKVAICSTAKECEKALSSIEPGLPKTRIPFNAVPLRDINTASFPRPSYKNHQTQYVSPSQHGHPGTPPSYRNAPPSFSTSLTPTTALGSAFISHPSSYYRNGSSSSGNYPPPHYYFNG